MSQLAQATRAFCPRLIQALKKRSMVSALALAHPHDLRPVQVVDEGGELPALAVGDLVDPERGQAADGPWRTRVMTRCSRFRVEAAAAGSPPRPSGS